MVIKDGKSQCLECKKWFKKVGNHINCHNLTVDEYRAKFGIRFGEDINALETKSNTTANIFRSRLQGVKDTKKLQKLYGLDDL